MVDSVCRLARRFHCRRAHNTPPPAPQVLEEGPRRALLRREMDKRLGDGKAKFDAQLLIKDLPRVGGAVV